MCSSLRDDHKRSKRITDRKRMRLICSFTDEAPLLSPLGDERLGTGYLGLKLTICNQRKALPYRGRGVLIICQTVLKKWAFGRI